MTTTDFTFAWEGADASSSPFAHLQVVRFRGHEELSSLYRYELTLLAKSPAPEVDPHDLIGARATLRIATLTQPACKVVHGILVEAEEINTVPDGMLYDVVLMPPLVRARHRSRSRIFLQKTTRQIIDAVLQGDTSLSRADGATVEDEDESSTSYTPAKERFTWRIFDPARIDDKNVRPYCVQYNESDLHFVSRLLEEEGIAYHFENGADDCLLVLSDDDQGKTRLSPFDPLGPFEGRNVSTLKLGGRLREKKIRLRDYDWRKPALALRAETGGDADLFESRYPGGFPHDAPKQGDPLAQARLDRLHIEAEYALGEGACRVLSAGSVFALEHDKARYDGEYLVTKLDVRGEQQGVGAIHATGAGQAPFSATFECARRGKGEAASASRFRPSRATPRPRIVGSQTAFVTAEPSAKGAEIHVGGPPGAEIGCVRLRFHWDEEEARLAKEPSSCWVRVSQAFAGVGEGGVWHPRVGVEVIVEHLDGDPDQPIVTGRVYNGANRPSANAVGAATVSTFKSFTSPGGTKWNELSFDDAAGSEQIKVHAAKDHNSEIGHDRAESVTNNSSSKVGVDRSETSGGNRSTQVTGNNTEGVNGNEGLSVKGNRSVSVGIDQKTDIGANRSMAIGVNESVTIGSNRAVSIGANDTHSVGSSRSITIGANLGETVGGDAAQLIGGNKATNVAGNNKTGVAGNSDEVVSGNCAVTVSGALTHTVSGAVTLHGAASIVESAGVNLTASAGVNAALQAGANLSLIAAAEAVLQGATVHVNGSGEIVLSVGGSAIKISGGGVEITGGALKFAGGTVDVTGGMVKIN